jgi:hypothetical protein
LTASAPPEIFALVGIIVFIVLSLMTYYSGVHRSGKLLPGILALVYQLAAFSGLGQIYFTNFLFQMDLETRNLLSIAYFTAAIANMVALNILAVRKRIMVANSRDRARHVTASHRRLFVGSGDRGIRRAHMKNGSRKSRETSEKDERYIV